jgi:hypothetical protein
LVIHVISEYFILVRFGHRILGHPARLWVPHLRHLSAILTVIMTLCAPRRVAGDESYQGYKGSLTLA